MVRGRASAVSPARSPSSTRSTGGWSTSTRGRCVIAARYRDGVQRNPDVDAWFERYDNPQKSLVLAVREVVLGADDRVSEAIKWQAPTFMYHGNIASFFPKTKQHVSLMLHTGARLPDPFGPLEGSGETGRVAKFADAEDLAAKRGALEGLIRSWIELKA